METPHPDSRAFRDALRSTSKLVAEVKKRVTTLSQFLAITSEDEEFPARAAAEASRHTAAILTAYHELLRDAGMVIVTRERWDTLQALADEDGWE